MITEKSLGIGFKKFWYRKMSRNWSQKNLVLKKSLGIGIVQILGLVTHFPPPPPPTATFKTEFNFLFSTVLFAYRRSLTLDWGHGGQMFIVKLYYGITLKPIGTDLVTNLDITNLKRR